MTSLLKRSLATIATGALAILGTVVPASMAAAAPGDVNLGQGATVTASSTQNDQDGHFPASNLIDGSLTTRWSAQNGPDSDAEYLQWVLFDLGQTAELSGLTLHWEAAYAKQFTVEVTTDDPSDPGATWTEVYDEPNSAGGTEDIQFGPVDATGVRLNLNERVSFDWDFPTLHWYGYSLFEVEIWGQTEMPYLGFSTPGATVEVGEQVTVPITLSGPATTDVTVDVKSVDGSALAGRDYDAVDETVTFAAGETSKDVVVTTIDASADSNRDFTLELSNIDGPAVLSNIDKHKIVVRAQLPPPTGQRLAIDDWEDGTGGIFPWGDGAPNTPVLSTEASTSPLGGNMLKAAVPNMTSWGGFSHDLNTTADWSAGGAFSLWFYGTNSGGTLRFELKSGGTSASTATMFEHSVVDDFDGWQEIVVRFADLRDKQNPTSEERFDASASWGYAVTLNDMGAGTWLFDDISIVEHTKIIDNFEGSVPIGTSTAPAGVIYPWGGDAGSMPTLEFLTDDRQGAAGSSNDVLAGTYQVSSYGGFSHDLAAAEDWSSFKGIRLWWYASQDTRPASPTAGNSIKIEIKDGGPNGQSSELWETSFIDNWGPDGNRWKLVELPFSQFDLRTDYQAGSGDTLDGVLSLDEAWGYAITFPVGTATAVPYRIDDVELYGNAVALGDALIEPTPQTVIVDGGDTAVVTISAGLRNGEPLPNDIEVAWSTSGDSAVAGTDYTAASGSVFFTAGEPSGSTREIEVDTTARSGELEARSLTVTLDSADGRVLSNAQVTLNASGMPYKNAALPIEERVDDLLGRMTLEEKIGQMTQAERLGMSSPADVTNYKLGSVLSGGGSVPADNTPPGWADMVDMYQAAALSTRLQIPMIYGVDAVHGHSNMVGATIFPHNIGLGASRNAEHIFKQGQVTAAEVRASGIPWTFAPTLAVTKDERWGRSYESFGEHQALVSLFSEAAVVGLQGEDPTSFNPRTEVLATAKHWVGDGSTTYNPSNPGYPIDQGVSNYADEAALRADIAPYLPAIAAGVGSIMPSYSAVSVAGETPVRMHENGHLNLDVLKDELGFDGFMVSDWEGIDKLQGGNYANKAVRTVNAGVDMAMAPYNFAAFISAITAAVNNNEVDIALIDDAVRRILTQKFALGLFENPFADRTINDNVGTAEHRAVARDAAADSQVLLKNDGILPLGKDQKVYVAGSIADNLGYQMGGWTIAWQGGSGNTTQGTTIGQAISDATNGNAIISPNASAPIGDADVAVVVVGEPPYAEGVGDVGENGFTLELRNNDRNIINQVCGQIDCVVLVVSGRPQITSSLTNVNALVASWLPGSEGAGVADVLFGDKPYTGRLPVTWPAAAKQVPINVGDANYAPEFAFGWGLRTDDPQERLNTLADELPFGAARTAVATAAAAAYWADPTPANAVDALRLLRQAADAVDQAGDFDEANTVVSAARDIVQSVIADGTAGYTIKPDHAKFTSNAELALLAGNSGEAVELLAEAISLDLSVSYVLSGLGLARDVVVGTSVQGYGVSVATDDGSRVRGETVTFELVQFDVPSGEYVPATNAAFAAGGTTASVVSNAGGLAIAPLVNTTAAGQFMIRAVIGGESILLPTVTVIEPVATEATLEVVPTVISGKITLKATFTNGDVAADKVVLKTRYGSKTFTNVTPGQVLNWDVKTFVVKLPAGDVTATVTTTGDVSTLTEGYSAQG